MELCRLFLFLVLLLFSSINLPAIQSVFNYGKSNPVPPYFRVVFISPAEISKTSSSDSSIPMPNGEFHYESIFPGDISPLVTPSDPAILCKLGGIAYG